MAIIISLLVVAGFTLFFLFGIWNGTKIRENLEAAVELSAKLTATEERAEFYVARWKEALMMLEDKDKQLTASRVTITTDMASIPRTLKPSDWESAQAKNLAELEKLNGTPDQRR